MEMLCGPPERTSQPTRGLWPNGWECFCRVYLLNTFVDIRDCSENQ